eukprot:TRINITY_DN30130_c0_g1_i1.p1 TRINITY_DN30130_c0_g1~~TRINITY_DN30130_c0_g1_i1.p1  ORF type:complete len:261 (+),score=44.79 TRINITY_DN30130_c0_g1_i1:34-783(+)
MADAAEAGLAGYSDGQSGGCVWEIETGAAPASARPKAVPRPPKWEAAGKAVYGRGVHRTSKGTVPRAKQVEQNSEKKLAACKAKQLETLQMFRNCEAENSWDKIHRSHYDWWMFPIDDGSKADFNVTSEADISMLRSDAEWLEGYRDAVRLVAKAWGWDTATAEMIEPKAEGMGYKGWDVRLAKICRSLFLFEEEPLLANMQKFAREIQRTEKAGGSFFYGRICLDELLYFELPRRAATGTVDTGGSET